jgi:hypothetical protein
MVCFRLIAFVVATLALAGCCASGNGCYVPVPGVPTAWDGAGTRPGEGPASPRQQRTARPKTEIIVGPITHASGDPRPQSVVSSSGSAGPGASDADKARDQKEAVEREADARLTKRLMICRNCLPSATGPDAVGTVR